MRGQFQHKYLKYATCNWVILVLGAVQAQRSPPSEDL